MRPGDGGRKSARQSGVLDLLDRFGEKLEHALADLFFRLGNARSVEIRLELADDLFVTGMLEVHGHDFLGIGFGIGLAEQSGSPETKEFVAARFSFELQFFVQRKLRFKGFFRDPA